jgi:hypothetical protein
MNIYSHWPVLYSAVQLHGECINRSGNGAVTAYCAMCYVLCYEDHVTSAGKEREGGADKTLG